MATFTATGTTSDGLPITVTGTIGGGALPPPPGINVLQRGAKGDSVTDDRAAIQAVLDGLNAGQAAYLPAASYKLSGPLLVRHSGTGLVGDGDASQLLIGGNRGLWIGGAQMAVDGVGIRKLSIKGRPGAYNADGNNQHAILCDGATNTTVEDVLLVGPGNGIYSVNGAVGTTHRRVLIGGWGATGLGLWSGALVEDCSLLQDDPNLNGQRSGHGLYIHTNTADITIRRTRVEAARMFGLQAYGEAPNTTIQRLTVDICQFVRCFGAATFAGYPATAARLKQVSVKNCDFLDTYGGNAVTIKQGDGFVFSGNQIRGGFQGIAIGQWASWEAGTGLITGLQVANNLVENCQYGIYALNSNGGQFQNCTLGPGNQFTGCAHGLIADGIPGITLMP